MFHFEAFARDRADPPRSEDMRVLIGTVAAEFKDVAALPEHQQRAILDPNAYAASQAYAKPIRAAEVNGVS